MKHPKKYRLRSSSMLYAPGFIRWAINGYRFERDRDKMMELVSTAWNIPEPVVAELLSEKVAHTVEGNAVVFESAATW